VKTIAFFNNKGGVGKTTLVYHLAWMFNEMGIDVVAMDLDPQANLTSAFLGEEAWGLWYEETGRPTLFGALEPMLDGADSLGSIPVREVAEHLFLVPGDLSLSRFEDKLADEWSNPTADPTERFRVTSALSQAASQASRSCPAQLALIDVGSGLGALSRAALLAADGIVIPYSLDPAYFSLRDLAIQIPNWRSEWVERRALAPHSSLPLPTGEMAIAGYVRLTSNWKRGDSRGGDFIRLPHPELGSLRPNPSLMPLAQGARKPMFLLKPADGAIGGHSQAVEQCYLDFKALAERLISACDLDVS
jgi:chromosome partitioning protein